MSQKLSLTSYLAAFLPFLLTALLPCSRPHLDSLGSTLGRSRTMLASSRRSQGNIGHVGAGLWAPLGVWLGRSAIASRLGLTGLQRKVEKKAEAMKAMRLPRYSWAAVFGRSPWRTQSSASCSSLVLPSVTQVHGHHNAPAATKQPPSL